MQSTHIIQLTFSMHKKHTDGAYVYIHIMYKHIIILSASGMLRSLAELIHTYDNLAKYIILNSACYILQVQVMADLPSLFQFVNLLGSDLTSPGLLLL